MLTKAINLLIGAFLIRQAYLLLFIPHHIHTFVTVFYPYLSALSSLLSIQLLLHQVRILLATVTIVAGFSLIIHKTIFPALLCQGLILMGKIGHLKFNMTVIHNYYIEIAVLFLLMIYQKRK